MASKKVVQTFKFNSTWTCPAGVAFVDVVTQNPNRFEGFTAGGSGGSGIMDTTAGFPVAWGNNANGQLGINSITNESFPIQLALLQGYPFRPKQIAGTVGTSAVSGQNYFMCMEDGTAYGWGSNGVGGGCLGIGISTAVSTPTQIVGGYNFSRIYPGDSQNAFGITPGGQLYGWGVNANGELGIGTATAVSSPVAVLGGHTFTEFKFSSNNNAGSCYALDTSGVWWAWGQNSVGQLGVGDIVSRSSPVQMVGGLTFTDIFVAPTVSIPAAFGITANGTAYAWGNGAQGMIGNNTANSYSSPVAVSGGLSFSSIYAGSSRNVYGLTTSGVPYAWGQNFSGCLGTGVGATTSYSTPTAVVGGLTFTKMYPNYEFAFGLTSAGQLYSWGNAANGALGQGTLATTSSPVLVVGGNTWQQFFNPIQQGAETTAVYGIDTTGYLWAWGYGTTGQIGNGTLNSYSSPVLVTTSFKPNTFSPYNKQLISVTPGLTYAIALNYQTMFGTTQVGTNCQSISLEYFL